MATTKNLATVPSIDLSNAVNLLAEVNGEIVRLPYSLIDEKLVPLEEHIDNENNPHKLDTDDIGAATTQEVQELKTEFSEYKISNDAELAKQKSDLNDLSNMKSGAIVQTASGESIVTNDSSDDPLRGLRVFGKTEQVTTTGAQLANLPDVEAYEVNGITWSCKNGIVTVKGTASDLSHSQDRIRFDIADIVAGTYYVSGSANGVNVHIRINTANDVQRWYNDAKFVLDGTEKQVRIYCQVLANATVDTKVYPMLNAGDTPLPYEPYTGGIPSPNPQYKQDLVSAGDDGDVEVGVYDGNLLDLTKFSMISKDKTHTTHGITFSNVNDEYIRVVGTATNYPNIQFNIDLPNGVYILSGTEDSKPALLRARLLIDGKNVDYACGKPFEVTDDISLITIIIQVDEGWTVDNIIYPMLNVGSTPLPYEPYKATQSLTALTPNGLPGIKVTDASLATYTDSNGQMWCADEIDFDRGVYVKRISQSVIDASVNIGLRDLNGFPRFDVYDKTAFLPSAVFDVGMCTHLSCSMSPLSTNTKDNTIASWHTGGVFFRMDRFATVEELKAWLVDNPIYLNYILATPIETPISDEEIAQYRALHSNYPVTTVLNDEGVHMEVKYNADTSTYIAQNYVPKSAYTELEARVLALETNAVS